jgi:hypothetical protein
VLQQFAERFGSSFEKYEEVLNDASTHDPRLRRALPNSVKDVPAAIEMGTARFSVKESIQSLQWLEENGACLDNIVGGTSTIPQASRGAFATRSIQVGEVISTTPVFALDRKNLKLFKEVKGLDGTSKRRHVGYQLILNYCYGHPESSLVLFPTSSYFGFINHGSKHEANAEIRWSSLPYHKSEWLNSTLDDIKGHGNTRLLLDIVAIKDIARGDEILLYYGEAWERKWEQHIAKWKSSSKNFTDILGVPTTADFNSIQKDEVIMTVAEREEDEEPLPENIMTRCGFALPGDNVAPDEDGKIKGYDTKDPKYVPCEILEAEPNAGTDRYTYRAKVEYTSSTGEVTLYSVKYDSGQNFMQYVDKPYTRDYYRKGAFRKSIGLSDGMFPSHWLDFKKDDR